MFPWSLLIHEYIIQQKDIVKKKAMQKLTDWFVDVEYSKVTEYDAEVEE